MIYDILVVGAGPSGSYLAYLLSKNGFIVKIIDKEDFPRDKVCGGGISNKTVELLDFDISPVIQKNIAGAFLSYQNKNTIIKDLEGGSGVTVLRRDFDNFILEKDDSLIKNYNDPIRKAKIYGFRDYFFRRFGNCSESVKLIGTKLFCVAK